MPQGRRQHLEDILDELVPDFFDELVAGGAPLWDGGDHSKVRNSIGGHQLVRPGASPKPQSISTCFPSRPLLEWNVRRRVRAIPNVTIRDGHDVVGLTSTSDRHQHPIPPRRISRRHAVHHGPQRADPGPRTPTDLITTSRVRRDLTSAKMANVARRRS
jgi:hypothetical protein